MKIRWFMLLLIGTIGGLTACNRQTVSSLPLPDAPSAIAPQSQIPAQAAANKLSPIPVPELIPPTVSAERLPQVEAGRADPFANLPMTPTVIPKPAANPPAASPNAAPTLVPLPPVTVTAPVPVVQSVPVTVPAVPPLPAPRPASPTQLAEAIEISGVMQVGDKTNIIVSVPDESTSRSVQVGDTLANGRVRVKRVEMGAEPVVILEQNGREVTRSVGSGTLMGLL